MNRKALTALLTFLIVLPQGALALQDQFESGIELIQDHLQYSSPKRKVNLRVSALADLEYYMVDQRPPGLIFRDHDFVQHRISVSAEGTLVPWLYGFMQAKFDRGVDPGFEQSDGRLEEYFLRWSPLGNEKLNLQVGKFAMVLGNWVNRHDSWSSPFITPPLVYENFTPVPDGAAPASEQAYLNTLTRNDNKRRTLPVIWGPSYATGAAVLGTLGDVDYAFEIKNASISSRPSIWRASQQQWTDPTVTGRLGWRPSAAWNFGVSGSLGSYLRRSARGTLPPGKDISDYLQVTAGQDFSFAHKKLQLWAEYYWSQFEIPFVGQANSFSYYLEGKYKLNDVFFLGSRWNQQFFGDVEDGSGGKKTWSRDIFRIDTSLGCRFSRSLQGKVQYSFNHRKGDKQQGENLLTAQLTLKI